VQATVEVYHSALPQFERSPNAESAAGACRVNSAEEY